MSEAGGTYILIAESERAVSDMKDSIPKDFNARFLERIRYDGAGTHKGTLVTDKKLDPSDIEAARQLVIRRSNLSSASDMTTFELQQPVRRPPKGTEGAVQRSGGIMRQRRRGAQRSRRGTQRAGKR